MTGAPNTAPTPGGHLPAHVLRFARLLRAAGLPVGTGSALDAVRALSLVDVTRRDELYWALHAVLVRDPAERELFEHAFRLVWRDPSDAAGAPALEGARDLPGPERPRPRRRVAEAWAAGADGPPPARGGTPEPDAAHTASARETLRTKDFREMSADEVRRARRVVERLPLALELRATRRFRADPRGPRVDPRATLRATLRAGGGRIAVQRRRRRLRPPPLVVLCDVSGSMGRYTRMLLHFAHALTHRRGRVRTFVFGTRLTEATRALERRDVDDALARLGRTVADWEGGTRIGRCLDRFNRDHARRALGAGAVVLLVTDGLDRDAGKGLARAAARLRRSCRRLVWLNPLLRFEGFEPEAAGVRALLPHVDEHRPVHDLASLEALAQALSRPLAPVLPGRRAAGMRPTARAVR